MARLLADLAEDVLFEALDAHQRECKFLPTVAEIRERADPIMDRRRKEAARLDAMARLIASGQHIPDLRSPAREPSPREDPRPMTAEEADQLNDILRKAGCWTRFRADGATYQLEAKEAAQGVRINHTGPPRKPTRQDYIDLGVDPGILDQIT
jgi:hypothetical protein